MKSGDGSWDRATTGKNSVCGEEVEHNLIFPLSFPLFICMHCTLSAAHTRSRGFNSLTKMIMAFLCVSWDPLNWKIYIVFIVLDAFVKVGLILIVSA